MQQVFNSWALIKSNFVSVEILLKILNLKDNFISKTTNIKISEFSESIEFKNVCFSYSNDSKNIKDLNLKIYPGEK